MVTASYGAEEMTALDAEAKDAAAAHATDPPDFVIAATTVATESGNRSFEADLVLMCTGPRVANDSFRDTFKDSVEQAATDPPLRLLYPVAEQRRQGEQEQRHHHRARILDWGLGEA